MTRIVLSDVPENPTSQIVVNVDQLASVRYEMIGNVGDEFAEFTFIYKSGADQVFEVEVDRKEAAAIFGKFSHAM